MTMYNSAPEIGIVHYSHTQIIVYMMLEYMNRISFLLQDLSGLNLR